MPINYVYGRRSPATGNQDIITTWSSFNEAAIYIKRKFGGEWLLGAKNVEYERTGYSYYH